MDKTDKKQPAKNKYLYYLQMVNQPLIDVLCFTHFMKRRLIKKAAFYE